jgi:hypothetical protein
MFCGFIMLRVIQDVLQAGWNLRNLSDSADIRLDPQEARNAGKSEFPLQITWSLWCEDSFSLAWGRGDPAIEESDTSRSVATSRRLVTTVWWFHGTAQVVGLTTMPQVQCAVGECFQSPGILGDEAAAFQCGIGSTQGAF